MKHNIFIIGPFAAGKSSLGYQLGRFLNLPFYDSDREVEKRSGVDIDWMFAVEGEEGFRQRELIIIDELSSQNGIVIATGGGTVAIPECKKMLSERGIVVYLKVPFSEQLSRVKRFPAKRPMLDIDDPAKKLKILNDERALLYESIANLTYTNASANPAQLAKKIIKDIKKLL